MAKPGEKNIRIRPAEDNSRSQLPGESTVRTRRQQQKRRETRDLPAVTAKSELRGGRLREGERALGKGNGDIEIKADREPAVSLPQRFDKCGDSH